MAGDGKTKVNVCFCGFQYYLDGEKGRKAPFVLENGWGG